jgi:hypothetical protein
VTIKPKKATARVVQFFTPPNRIFQAWFQLIESDIQSRKGAGFANGTGRKLPLQ